MCYQGFTELFYKLSTLIFHEPANIENVKSLIYFCKISLKLKGLRSNQYFDIDIDFTESLHNTNSKLLAFITTDTTQSIAKTNNEIFKHLNENSNYLSENLTNANSNNFLLDKSYKYAKKKSVFPLFF